MARNFTFDQLEKEVTCGICQEHYTEPKVLPCLHYYCKQCITRLAFKTGTSKPFFCPECRSQVTLLEGGVDELKSAFFINRFLSTFITLQRAHGKVEVNCEMCVGAPAESFCRQCAMFICKMCVESHSRMKTLFASHQVNSLQELKEGRAKAEAIVSKEPPLKCGIHGGKLKIYCFNCDSVICRDCTVVDHRDHKFQFCVVAAPEMKKDFLKELEPLRQVGYKLSQAVEEVKSTRHEVEAQGEAVAQTINSSFDELLQIVEKRRKELLDKARRRVQEKVNKLTVQEKTLSLASAEVQSVLDYTERCVGHCTDNEVMSMHIQIKEQIKKKMDQQNQSDRDMSPTEDMDVGVEVRCAEDLHQLCQTKTRIIQIPVDPAKCTVTGKGVKTAEVNKVTKVTLTAKFLLNNKPTRRSAVVTGHLLSLYNGLVVNCDVDNFAPGEYHIQYIPKVRGRHKLSVSVDGQQVAGSPFSVLVSIHPKLLGKPVKILETSSLNRPEVVTTTSLGQVIVGQYSKDAVVFLSKGKQVKIISKVGLNLQRNSSLCLALDREDNLYLASYVSNKILKLDKTGNIVIQTETKEVDGCLGIAVSGETVVVTPYNTIGTIVIYDKELSYVKRIVGNNMGQLHGVSPDSWGNLHVTDKTNKCVQVFSKCGNFLRSYGCNAEKKTILTNPQGLFVCGQYVYVCNNGEHNYCCVCVFTTEGDYVTMIGRRGRGEGQFSTPISVCVDTEGFVHVCDCFNNRIQIF